MNFDEVLPGVVERNDEGACWRMDRCAPSDGMFGRMPLARLAEFASPLAAMLAREPRLASLRPEELAFFDTETTGLGGAGTKIFLAGVGRWSPKEGGFAVTQFLLRDYEDEPALLKAVHVELMRYPAVVTYNGKRFDWPLMQERLILNRMRLPLPHAHYDVLHPSRRLWRRIATDCSLTTLEKELLGHKRLVDVPGALAPEMYFRYLRERDPAILVPVVEHNAHDIVALAALAALNHDVIASVERETPEEAALFAESEVDWVSVGRLWDSQGSQELALRAFGRAKAAGEEPAAEGALAAGNLLKRLGRLADAVPRWQSALASLEPSLRLEALEELAKHEEWRAKRPAEALGFTERALSLLSGLSTAPAAWRERFRIRQQRLLRKSPAI